jgi:hypothetical protein
VSAGKLPGSIGSIRVLRPGAQGAERDKLKAMALAPSGYINQRQLEAEIDRAIERLGPEVVLVRHSFGPDSSGEPSVFFRIVLTDSASREETLADVTGQIVTTLFDELRPYENWGLIPYFSFRSQSEYTRRYDLAWA